MLRELQPHVVERATHKPGKCVVTGDIDGPFLDCGLEYENRGYWHHLYLHLPWIEEMGRKHCGMVSATDYQALKDELKAKDEELEVLQIAFEALTDARKVAV